MIVTLTTDFGLKDGYVGAMRGVILGLCVDVQVVDITHLVPPQDLVHGALALRESAPYFPVGTVHVGVIDPGVGTARRGMVARAGGHTFVGPDNGLFEPVLAFLASGGPIEAWSIESDALTLPNRSSTFHGRDVFAPVAAHLARGVAPERVGPPIHDRVRGALPEPRVVGDRIEGCVARVDHFGNLVTNIPAVLAAGRKIKVSWPGRALEALEGLSATYADAQVGSVLVLEGSTGYIEVAVNQGSAHARLLIDPGAQVLVLLEPV